MAKKIADTKKLSREEWLELRKKSIGGSDAGALVGMNPYSSPITVYADKMGLSKEKETSEAMRLGTDLEAYVAERFCEKEDKKVRNDFYMYADDKYEFLTANIDRRIVGENAGLECKTMGSFNGYNFDIGEVPGHYYCQCQHYMMVMGFDRMYLAILVLQRGLYVIPIERNDTFIADLRKAECDFWYNNILKDKMPEPDGSESAFDTLKEIYPDAIPKSEKIIGGLDQMIVEYNASKEMRQHYEERENLAKSKICALLGETEYGLGHDWSCSWKKQSKPGIDMKRLKFEMPAVYEKYSKPSEFRVFRVKDMTKTKETNNGKKQLSSKR